ncbi:MAG TPA: polysaccharide deacetylase family protein [Kofleriaceae bacterium]
MKLWLGLIALAACGDNIGKLAYTWNDDPMLCSTPVDDYEEAPNWSKIDDQLADAAHYGWVALFHAHVPGETVTRATLDRLFSDADAQHLEYAEFRELVPSTTPHGAIAFAFDDDSPDAWASVTDILEAHHARITLFVTRWNGIDDAGHAEIAQLAADGADVEPHTVNHIHAPDYVVQHGIDAYMADEVLPSFDVLSDAGYPQPASFAYPFGDHTPEIDRALLEVVGTVRTTPGQCDQR